MGFDPYTPISQAELIESGSSEQSYALREPSSVLHRTVEDAIDVLPDDAPTKMSQGVNLRGYQYAHVHAVATGATAQPTINIYQWSAGAGKFVPFISALTAASPGAEESFSSLFDVGGATIWVGVTGTVGAGDKVEIHVSGAIIDSE